MPGNIRCIQPGGGTIQYLELAWGRLRRWALKRYFPGHVAQMAQRMQGYRGGCPVEVIDSRDLKHFRNVCNCWFEPEDDPYYWREKLPFARAGFAELAIFGGGAMALTLLAATGWAWSRWWALLPGVFAAFVVYFFRDPQRGIPQEANAVVSPADGKIVDVLETEDPFIGEPAVRIGIFLSVFDVHVNRCAMTGQVIRLEYQPGKFINALYAKSAEENERLTLFLAEPTQPHRRFVIRQISGAIARRIVCEARTGQVLEAGQRFGMIKFGSRTELLLPAKGLQLAVKVGDKVKGGSSLLGHYQIAPEEAGGAEEEAPA